MENYSDQIVKAYNKWISIIESEPSESYDPKYQSWKAKQKRAANIFEAVCKSQNLNYLEVYKELTGKITIIGFQLSK